MASSKKTSTHGLIEGNKYFWDWSLIKKYGLDLFVHFKNSQEKFFNRIYIEPTLENLPELKNDLNIAKTIKYVFENGKRTPSDPSTVFLKEEGLEIIFKKPTDSERKDVEAVTSLESRMLNLNLEGYKEVKFPRFEEKLKSAVNNGLVNICDSELHEHLKHSGNKVDLKLLGNEIPFTAFVNQYIHIKPDDGSFGLIYQVGKEDKVYILKNVFPDLNKTEIQATISTPIFNLIPNSLEQYLALQLILDPKIKFVFLGGAAGTGKTLLTLAGGIYQLMQSSDLKEGDPNYKSPRYGDMTIFTDRQLLEITPDDKHADIRRKEKERQSFFPRLEKYVKLIDRVGFAESSIVSAIFNESSTFKNFEKQLCLAKTKSMRTDQGIVSLLNPYFMGSETLNQTYGVLDETVNLSPELVKNVLGHADSSSKIIICGDVAQRKETLGNQADGFLWAINKFVIPDETQVGLMKLDVSYTSRLARKAYEE